MSPNPFTRQTCPVRMPFYQINGQGKEARTSTTGQSARATAVGFSMRTWTCRVSAPCAWSTRSAMWTPSASSVSKEEESSVWTMSVQRQAGSSWLFKGKLKKEVDAEEVKKLLGRGEGLNDFRTKIWELRISNPPMNMN